jgi:hypothetical protein
MNQNLAQLGFAGHQRSESLHRVESNGRAGRTQGRHRRFSAQALGIMLDAISTRPQSIYTRIKPSTLQELG